MTQSKLKFDYSNAKVWADVTDYVSTLSGFARTHQMDLTSLLNTTAWQGAEADLGSTIAANYGIWAAVEMASASAATSLETFSYYWVPLTGASLGFNDNIVTGGGSYSGTTADSLEDSLAQFNHIKDFPLTTDVTPIVQFKYLGTVSGAKLTQYGAPIVYNKCATGDHHSDAAECFFAMVPVIDET